MQIDEHTFKRSIRSFAGLFIIATINTLLLMNYGDATEMVKLLLVFTNGMAAGGLLTHIMLYKKTKESSAG